MKVTALEPFRAELSELQIAVADTALAASVHEALARHRVVVFRDRRVGDANLIQFFKTLGPLMFTAGETPAASFIPIPAMASGHPRLVRCAPECYRRSARDAV